MIVLVTGGHGFVGSHLVERLLAAGDTVRCLSRRQGPPERLAGLPVEVVAGDLGDGRGLSEAVRGVEEVWHLGALTRARTPAEMLRVNTGGTLALARAAARAGARRFLFCSSLAAVGPSPDGALLAESAPLRPKTVYGLSKQLAEQGLWSLGEPLAVTVLRPPAVYGPYDRDLLALFRGAQRGLLPVVGSPERRLSLIHAADLAEGMLHAGRSEAAQGKAWFVTHAEAVRQADLAEALGVALGRRVRRLPVPASAARVLGTLSSLLAQLTGRAPLLTRERIREVGEGHWVCSGEALAAATGWRARTPLATGLASTAQWYRERGWL